MKKILSLYVGEAWKLQNLLKHTDDFIMYTSPLKKLNVTHL